MLLRNSFEDFLTGTVSLDDTRMSRVQSAHRSVRRKLKGIEAVRAVLTGFYLQGSYALLTACRPCGDQTEYDVDLVLAADFRDDRGRLPSGWRVLNWLQRQIESISLYEGKTTVKKCCVRIDYESDGQRFHLDVVPAHRPDTKQGVIRVAPGWGYSNPRGYKRWFELRRKRSKRLRHVVRLLKYWRNLQECGPNSMILTTLAARHAPKEFRSLDDALVKTMRGMNGWLQEQNIYGAQVLNPSLEEEDLARDWWGMDVAMFQHLLGAATDKAEEALASKDEAETIELWNGAKLFDGRFPKTLRGLGEDAKAAAEAIGDGLAVTPAGLVSIGAGRSCPTVEKGGGFYGEKK